MCICIHCHFVDRCNTYYAVEHQHHQPHLTDNPVFEPQNPSVNVNIRPTQDYIEVEWDVVGCDSFVLEHGKWATLRPGQVLPT